MLCRGENSPKSNKKWEKKPDIDLLVGTSSG